MSGLIRLGWRDLARNRRFALLFICNLSIGLIGFLLVGSFARSVDRHLASHLRDMLTGDLVVQSARPLTDQEEDISRTITGAGSRFSRQITFYTMVKGSSSAKLTQIVAIDEAYPLYGRFSFAENNIRSTINLIPVYKINFSPRITIIDKSIDIPILNARSNLTKTISRLLF